MSLCISLQKITDSNERVRDTIHRTSLAMVTKCSLKNYAAIRAVSVQHLYCMHLAQNLMLIAL